MTDDEYRELSARVESLETQMGSMRARYADQRGELAGLHDAVQDIRQVQREQNEVMVVLTDLAREHGQKLDEHSRALTALGTDVVEIRGGVAELRGDAAEIRTDVAGLRTDVAQMTVLVGAIVQRLDER